MGLTDVLHVHIRESGVWIKGWTVTYTIAIYNYDIFLVRLRRKSGVESELLVLLRSVTSQSPVMYPLDDIQAQCRQH